MNTHTTAECADLSPAPARRRRLTCVASVTAALALALLPATPAMAAPHVDDVSLTEAATEASPAADPTPTADAVPPGGASPAPSAPPSPRGVEPPEVDAPAPDTPPAVTTPSAPAWPGPSPSPPQRLDTGQGGAPAETSPPVYAREALTLYRDPSAATPALVQVVAGSHLRSVLTQGEWSKVSYGAVTGWTLTARLDAQNPVTKMNTVGYATKRLTLTPSTNADGARLTVPAGSQIQVIGSVRSWERIRYNNASGYVIKGKNWTSAQAIKPSSLTVWSNATTALYAATTPSSTRRHNLLAGTKLKVTGVAGEWSRVTAGTPKGWVLTSALANRPALRAVSGERWLRINKPLRRTSDFGAPVTTLPIGDKVTLISAQGSWVRVRYGRSTGYVIASRDLSTRIPVRPVTATTKWVKRDAALRQHTGRRPYARAVTTLPIATSVRVTGRIGPWAQVRYTGKVGYVLESNTLAASITVKPVRGQARFARKSLALRATTARAPYAASLATIPAGAKVRWTGSVGPWARVSYAGKSGFVTASSGLTRTNRHSFSVYGTLRRGGISAQRMRGYAQRDAAPRIASTHLYFWQKKADPKMDVTVILRGSGSVAQEQYRYSSRSGPTMFRKLDSFESYYKISGRRVYTPQLKSLTDGTISWTFYANPALESTLKRQSTLVRSGDFNDRRRY